MLSPLQISLASAAALRCGFGGLVSVSRDNYYVTLRGALLPELSELIRSPHKKIPEQVCQGTTPKGAVGWL